MGIIRMYPKIFNLGHRALSHLFDDEVEITSKIDGSQLRIYADNKNVFEVGTHKTEGLESMKYQIAMTKLNHKTDMFEIAIEQAENLKSRLSIWVRTNFGLQDITLYIEYLRKRHHNGLTYDRVPKNNLYLFGAIVTLVNGNTYNYDTDKLIELANYLDIEPPNILYQGKIDNQEELKKLLETESVLGGTKEEGIAIKNYHKIYSADSLSTESFVGFPLAGKLVRDEYKEVQRNAWDKQKKATTVDGIAETYLTEARFLKSVQHLKEENKLEFERKDLAILIPEVLKDLLSEEKEHIDKLVLNKFYEGFRKKLSNCVVKQYNQFLLNKQFEE